MTRRPRGQTRTWCLGPEAWSPGGQENGHMLEKELRWARSLSPAPGSSALTGHPASARSRTLATPELKDFGDHSDLSVEGAGKRGVAGREEHAQICSRATELKLELNSPFLLCAFSASQVPPGRQMGPLETSGAVSFLAITPAAPSRSQKPFLADLSLKCSGSLSPVAPLPIATPLPGHLRSAPG